MEAVKVEVDFELARQRLRAYRDARAPKTPQDVAIMKAYRQIVRGKTVIRAHESIRQAGFDEQGRPRLAMARANEKRIDCNVWSNRIEFAPDAYVRWNSARNITIKLEQDSKRMQARGRAVVPLIPLHLRPRGSLYPYYVLWEAAWQALPVDPLLLRKLTGDLYIVLAAWDLTAVEQAALAGAL